MRTLCISVAVLALLSMNVVAQVSGDLDSTFSADGIATTDVQPPSSDGALCMALQPDGRIIVAGSSIPQVGGTTSLALARYLPNGSLDPSFGTGGTVTTAVGVFDDVIHAIALQPDGKIVVAGTTWTNGLGYEFLVARYDSTGALDPSFSGDGIQVNDLGTGSEDRAGAVAIQPNGKIVVAGFAQNADEDMLVCRYNSDGSFDTSFSGDGHVTIGFSTNNDRAGGLVIQPDGMIAIAGYTNSGSDGDFALVRLTTAGIPDTGFGTNGTVFTSFGPGIDQGACLLLQPDGKLVAGGVASNGLQLNPALARYEPDGDLDPSFDGDGLMTSLFSSFGSFGSVALLPDGRIVAGGNSGSILLLSVFNPNGSPDNSFSGDGALSMALGTYDYGTEVAVQADGKILLAGYSNFSATLNDFVVLRFHTDLSIGVLEFTGMETAPLIYPNPIGDQATLRYALKSSERITMRLTDAHGRVVMTFLDGVTQSAGEQRVELQLPQTLATGSYLLTIAAADHGTVSVRMVKE